MNNIFIDVYIHAYTSYRVHVQLQRKLQLKIILIPLDLHVRTSDVVVSEQGVFPCVAAVPSHVPELVPALSEAESNRVTDDQQ